MSRVSLNKKFLNLSNVRVAYRPKDDTIHITSTDKDLVGEAFKVTLKPGSESDSILRQLLFEKGIINEKSNPEGLLPQIASLKLDSASPWYSLPIGEGAEGPISIDARTHSSILIAGAAGTGKSIVHRNLIHHCLTHNDQWAVYGIDLKKVELNPYLRYENTVREIATSLSETLQMLSRIKDEMYRRYDLMEKHGVNNLADFADITTELGDSKAVMIILEDVRLFYQSAPELSLEDREAVFQILDEIVRLGRAAKIYTVISSQNTQGISHLVDLFTVKIALGRLTREASFSLLGDDTATRITDVRGRGLIVEFNEKNFFQSYYSAPSSGEEWVLDHGQNAEPELYKQLTELS